jgi:ubiquinone/menaquinone biosynthesis C-methylase UbiE
LAAQPPDALVRPSQGRPGTTGRDDRGSHKSDAAEQVIELLDVQPGDKVLEVDFAIQLLLQRVHAASVAGVDESQEMVHQAAAHNVNALRSGRVDLRYGSVERLSFANHTFDKALAINSMQAWPDPNGGLKRVLKNGGKIALGSTANSGQPKKHVAESLAAAGFAQTRIVDRSKLFCVFATKP